MLPNASCCMCGVARCRGSAVHAGRGVCVAVKVWPVRSEVLYVARCYVWQDAWRCACSKMRMSLVPTAARVPCTASRTLCTCTICLATPCCSRHVHTPPTPRDYVTYTHCEHCAIASHTSWNYGRNSARLPYKPYAVTAQTPRDCDVNPAQARLILRGVHDRLGECSASNTYATH